MNFRNCASSHLASRKIEFYGLLRDVCATCSKSYAGRQYDLSRDKEPEMTLTALLDPSTTEMWSTLQT